MLTLEMAGYVWRWLMELFPSRPEPVPMPEPTDRRELFEQLEALRTKRAAESAQHRQDVDALTRQWQEVQGRADEIQHRISVLQREDFGASMAATVQEDTLLNGLEGKASMSVVLALADLDHELQRLYLTEETVIPSVTRNYDLGKKFMGVVTNAASMKRRAEVLHRVRARVRAMQFEPMSIADMNSELLTLKKSIPEIVNEDITTERAAILAHV